MESMLLFLAMMSAGISAMAGEPTDSTMTRQLDEVVVEAQMQAASSNVTVYYPDRNSKRAAQNAVDLLERMAIPQINVNPVDGSVATPAGDEISIYIDMEKATQEEKDALRPEDVRKVEYFIYPSDPRFNHEKYVINITLQHYDYGGYAKFSATGNLLAGSGSGQTYAKTAYKRMTYDISVNDKYTDRHHTGTDRTQVFRFPLADGSVSEITRCNLLEGSRYTENKFGASFRARYTSEKAVVSNSFFLTVVNAPHNDNSGKLSFNSGAFNSGSYINTMNSSYLYPRWSGNYYFDLGDGFKLNAMPSFFYQHTKSDRRYAADETVIVTNATEDAATAQLQVQLNKTFRDCHTVDFNLLGIYYYDKVEYSGNTVASPEFNQFAYGGIFGYTFAKDRFYGQLAAGFAGESNKISGGRTNSFIPLFEMNAQYALDQKNQFSLSAQYNINAVSASDKTPDIIQENELLCKTGNLHLKNTHWSRVTLDYTWLPNNKFSVSAFSGWSRYFNHLVPVFSPEGPGGMMLRSLVNNGDYQDIYVGGNFSAKLFGRKLVMKASPRMWFERITGMYSDTNNYLQLSLSATYYFKQFYASAYWSSASRELVQYDLDATSVKHKSSYQFKLGWSDGAWNVSVAAVNIFRDSWLNNTSCLKSKWFDQYSAEYNANRHQFVSLTASYTFGFGKKIRRGDEVKTEEAGSSAIMK